jgi:hypothetical protein
VLQSGTKARIKPRDFLQEFQRTWKFHDPLQDFQLDYAGQIATVDSVGYYFGADELYTLHGIAESGMNLASNERRI